MMDDEAAIDYLPIGVYPLFVGFTMSKKAYLKEMKRLEIVNPSPFLSDNSNATCHHFVGKTGRVSVIAMKRPTGVNVGQVAGLIAHEAVHVVQRLWDEIGETDPGHEAEAYLVQTITQGCLALALNTGRERRRCP